MNKTTKQQTEEERVLNTITPVDNSNSSWINSVINEVKSKASSAASGKTKVKQNWMTKITICNW